jgi:hypothetical protein
VSWVKIDDKFRHHPKVIAAGLEGSWLYVCALAYCGEQLTDGYLPEGVLPVLAPHVTDPTKAADTCCTVGLLRRVDGGYEVPDYLDYNPSRAKVIAEREAARKRQSDRRARATTTDDMSRRESRRDFGRSSPSPTRPDPTPESVNNQPSSGEPGDPGYPQGEVDNVLDYLVDVAETNATITKNRAGWRRSTRRRLATEHTHEITRLLERYPTADTRDIGNAVIDGDQRNLHARYGPHVVTGTVVAITEAASA